jgi:hypothetical protein
MGPMHYSDFYGGKMAEISQCQLSAVEEVFRRYTEVVNDLKLRDSSKRTYLLHADQFVRWLAGRFTPGEPL